MSTAAAANRTTPLLALYSSDIDVPNRQPPPGWTQVVYRLDLDHAQFHGVTRLLAMLDDGAVHLLFPDGRDLRLRGVLVE
jgi:hypothetical protein